VWLRRTGRGAYARTEEGFFPIAHDLSVCVFVWPSKELAQDVTSTAFLEGLGAGRDGRRFGRRKGRERLGAGHGGGRSERREELEGVHRGGVNYTPGSDEHGPRF